MIGDGQIPRPVENIPSYARNEWRSIPRLIIFCGTPLKSRETSLGRTPTAVQVPCVPTASLFRVRWRTLPQAIDPRSRRLSTPRAASFLGYRRCHLVSASLPSRAQNSQSSRPISQMIYSLLTFDGSHLRFQADWWVGLWVGLTLTNTISIIQIDRNVIGGEGGIRTHVPGLPDHLISSQRRYGHFGTSPDSCVILPVMRFIANLHSRSFAN